MIPKAVVFDLGKVLLNFDYRIASSNIQTHCRISLQELQRLIDQSPLLYRYETNLLSTEQFFAEVQSLSGYSGSLEEFSRAFGDIFTPIDPMVRLQAQLRAQKLPLYLFSNTNFLAVEHIRQRYPFFHDFDGYVLSCEHGAMKPEEKIYRAVEELAGVEGPHLLYIDDRPENIATGIRRGWQTILHENPERTIEAVRRTGLLSQSSGVPRLRI